MMQKCLCLDGIIENFRPQAFSSAALVGGELGQTGAEGPEEPWVAGGGRGRRTAGRSVFQKKTLRRSIFIFHIT